MGSGNETRRQVEDNETRKKIEEDAREDLELGDKNAVNVLGGTDHKHIAGVKYEDISISTGPIK